MNQDPGDKLVSAEYRAIARERTPAELDAAILGQAKAAASRLQDFTALWFRPLAFVATLALSLALLLEWTSTPELQPVRGPEARRMDAETFEFDPGVETGEADAPGTTSQFLKNSASPAGEEPAAEPAISVDMVNTANGRVGQTSESDNKPARDEGALADFTEVIEATSKKAPGTDSVSRNAIEGLRQSQPESRAQLEDVVVSGSRVVGSDVAARPCDEEQTADPESWWLCIEDLAAAGRLYEASAELERLRAAYPEFEVPGTLPSQ